MNTIEKIIAGTAFEIVARSFTDNGNYERQSFRLKTFTQKEVIEFLNIWRTRSSEHGLEPVRLLIASDSHQDFPQEFRADPQHSITYYRNNNENGLVYVETKVESDAQGLQNIFTLKDVNFLDGTFDENDHFHVPSIMITQALSHAGSTNPEGHKLLRERLLEVLESLNTTDAITVPVRKFARFISAAAQQVANNSEVYSSDEIDNLVGKCLVNLDMFPDKYWRIESGSISRRLYLNRLRAELAASPTTDLDAEKTAERSMRIDFLNEDRKPYSPDEKDFWRKKCSDYCIQPTCDKREQIPYRIFEQVFSKDVKGLPLGERVAQEILEASSSRKAEFDALAVEKGLNNRSEDDARKFLESEPEDSDSVALRYLLSKQTLSMINKLAFPKVETVQNPLIKLAHVAIDLWARNNLQNGEFRLEVRVSADISDAHTPMLGLFAFLYGKSLLDLSDSLADGLSSISLDVDPKLTTQKSVPPLIEDSIDAREDTLDPEVTNEGTPWLPIPLEFVLIDTSNDTAIDSESAIEWMPDNPFYLALFWISTCGDDAGDINEDIFIPPNETVQQWISKVVKRRLPLANGVGKQQVALEQQIVERLAELRLDFRNQARADGISTHVLNDVFDKWSILLSDARKEFVPYGDLPEGMTDFLSADCVHSFDGTRVLMLQSHPLKLRWIAAYLQKSWQLASDALDGSLRLNNQNEKLYLNWIQGLSPHQQPAIHTAQDGEILFATSERGWTEVFKKASSVGKKITDERLHDSLVAEFIGQITAYLHSHPYKADGLRILVVTESAWTFPTELVQGLRKGEFKDLPITIEFIAPRKFWDAASRHFDLVDTDNRLTGHGALFPAIQLNFHDLDKVKNDLTASLGDLHCDIAIVPHFLDDKMQTDAKTEGGSELTGEFNPLLDDPTYIVSGSGSAALWVSMRPRMPDAPLADWSTLVVRHERKSPVASDRPQATDFIDIRINFDTTSRFFNELHKRSHWVITLERHITREQLEKLETRPQVLSLRQGVGPGGMFTLIVSSSAGKLFVIARLRRKLKRIASALGRDELVEKRAAELAEQTYNEARQIAPRRTLDALGISRVTEELLGLSIARTVGEQQRPISIPLEEGIVAWISLDEHPEWFADAKSLRADLMRLAINLEEEGVSVDVLIIESKLRKSGYDSHGAEQVHQTLRVFDPVFMVDGGTDPIDGELWREMILSAVDTVSEDAFYIWGDSDSVQTSRRSRVTDEIRSRFRSGDFKTTVNLAGLYCICEYSHSRETKIENYEKDSRILIVQTDGNAVLNRSIAAATTDKHKENVASRRSHHDDVVLAAAENEENHDSETRSLHDYTRELEPPFEDDSRTVRDTRTAAESRTHLGQAELDHRYQLILDTFGEYGVNVDKASQSDSYAIEGPASILFKVRPGTGVAPNKIKTQHDALKLALELEASQDIRFGIDRGYVTIDVPKLDHERYFVRAPDLWSRWERPKVGLTVPFGEDRFGSMVKIDFASSTSPHLLIGGTTGSGKSEALNTILTGVIRHYTPDEVRLRLIDPKGTELEHFSESKHLDAEIGLDEDDAIKMLSHAVEEMQDRYSRFKSRKVKSLDAYNNQASPSERLSRWVIVVDEYGDLTSEPEKKKEIERQLIRLAQKARAAGIHLIIATQKPDASVISTNLRSNLPAQLALRVKGQTESRVILDEGGAETLTGKGDALFKESGNVTRVQCAMVEHETA